jgi:hypothetical protein
MSSTAARLERDDRPPSTPGTSDRRARRWPLRVGLLALGVLAVAAPMVAAEPASAPVTAEAASAVRRVAVEPASPIRRAKAPTTAFASIGDVTYLSAVVASEAGGEIAPPPPPPPPPPTTTTTTAPPAPPTTAAPAPAPEPATGRCGGDLPPCWVMQRESGGSLTAKNPSSTASGKWQFLNSTWAGFGGYAEAWMAPESVQDEKARILWAGGAGCSHWSAC